MRPSCDHIVFLMIHGQQLIKSNIFAILTKYTCRQKAAAYIDWIKCCEMKFKSKMMVLYSKYQVLTKQN